MKHRRKIITTGALWSEKLASVDHAAERLYWRVYMASDNYGVMSGKPWDVCQQATPGVSGFTRTSVEKALDALVVVGLLERWEEPDGAAYVFVIGHDEHQAADFLRKRGMRRSPMPPSQKPITVLHIVDEEAHNPSSDAVPCPSRELGSEGHEVVAPPTTTTTSKEKRDTSEKAAPVADTSTRIRQVFDYWHDQTSTGRGRRPVLDPKRRSRITARLGEGFKVDDLKACVDGFLQSPWHNGTESGTRYLGIETIFRDAAQVEKGMALAAAAPAAGVTTEQAALLASLPSLGGAA